MVPAADLMLHVTGFKPFRPQDPGGVAVLEPLRPGGVVVLDALQRHGVLTFQDDTGPGGIEPFAPVPGTGVERVKENAIRSHFDRQA